MHLLDVLVTQHAKWTANRIRRGLFGQALVDFSAAHWSSIQLQDSARCPTSQKEKRPPKKTPRLLRSFAQTRVISKSTDSVVPGMNLYDDGDVDVGTVSEDADSVSFSTPSVNFEESAETSISATANRRTEFFNLSPK